LPISIDERLDILQRTSRSWLELKKAIERLSDDDLSRPNTVGNWSGRDLMVHVASWDEEMTRLLRDLDAGKPERWPDTEGDRIDVWNGSHVAAFRNVSIVEARRYFEGTHFEFMDVLEKSPSVTAKLVGTYHQHYDEHLPQFQALKRR
jgi:hypothetical protein